MKYHWSDSKKEIYGVACGDKMAVRYRICPAETFAESASNNASDYCCDCLERARQSLDRTDSERYAELRALVEAYQTAKSYEDDAPLQALRNWIHR